MITGALQVQLIVTHNLLTNALKSAQAAVKVAEKEPEPLPAAQLTNINQCVADIEKALDEVSTVMDWAGVDY